MFSLPKQQHFLLIVACLLSGIFIASAILFAQPGYARALGCGNTNDGPGGGRDPGDEISSCPDSYYCSDGKRYKQDKRERQDGGGSGWIWVRTAYAAGEGRRDVYDSGPSGGCVNNGPPVRVPSQDYLCAPASCTITANPSSITEGQSTKLIWSATSPDGSNYSGKISHSLGSDTYPVSQASSGNFSPSQSITYTFSGTFSSGPFSCSVPVVVTSVRPSVDLQVRKIGTTLWLNPTAGSPLRIGVSDEVELKWDSLNATSCTSGDFTVPGGSVNGRTSDVVEPAVGSTKPYTITCTNGSDTDSDSVYVEKEDENPEMIVPTLLSAAPSCSSTGGSRITLAWTSTGASDYHIERCVGSSCTTVIKSGTNYVDTNRTPGTTYQYRIRAHDHTTDPRRFSLYSNSLSATALFCSEATCDWILFCAADGDLYYGDPARLSCPQERWKICPNGCSGTTCNDPDEVLTASSTLQVIPSLVRKGQTTRVYWDSRNVSSCSVSGTNGDSWGTKFSGLSGKETLPITEQTIYTLSCTALPNASPPSITATKTVNVIPVFEER